MSFLDRIAACNTHDLAGFRPFEVAGARVGHVRPEFAARLAGFADVFEVTDAAVWLNPALDSFEARSTAVAPIVRALSDEGLLPGWRGELYPVAPGFSDPPLLRIERAAVPAFGVRACGVHMNGFVRKDDGLHMWIGRRAKDKPTFPGMLDNMVAGGQPLGIGLRENLVKECAEEANIPRSLAEEAVSVGAITYVAEAPEGLKPDVQFCFDLEVPADFTPENTDGELDDFMLWPIGKVAEVVRDTTEFKFNCNLVIIDFLVRHGEIAPDHPDYLEIVSGLHRQAF